MVAQFQLNVFGSPQLVRGGSSPVRFRTKKHLAVLLYLHFEGRARSIPRDRLVDLLWPEVPPDKGRHSLSQALLAIRTRLGTGAVTGREHDVQLLTELPSDLSALRSKRCEPGAICRRRIVSRRRSATLTRSAPTRSTRSRRGRCSTGIRWPRCGYSRITSAAPRRSSEPNRTLGSPGSSGGWSAGSDPSFWLSRLTSPSGSSGRTHSSAAGSSWGDWKRSGIAWWAAPVTKAA